MTDTAPTATSEVVVPEPTEEGLNAAWKAWQPRHDDVLAIWGENAVLREKLRCAIRAYLAAAPRPSASDWPNRLAGELRDRLNTAVKELALIITADSAVNAHRENADRAIDAAQVFLSQLVKAYAGTSTSDAKVGEIDPWCDDVIPDPLTISLRGIALDEYKKAGISILQAASQPPDPLAMAMMRRAFDLGAERAAAMDAENERLIAEVATLIYQRDSLLRDMPASEKAMDEARYE